MLFQTFLILNMRRQTDRIRLGKSFTANVSGGFCERHNGHLMFIVYAKYCLPLLRSNNGGKKKVANTAQSTVNYVNRWKPYLYLYYYQHPSHYCMLRLFLIFPKIFLSFFSSVYCLSGFERRHDSKSKTHIPSGYILQILFPLESSDDGL